jgi:CspA family cold shock protein
VNFRDLSARAVHTLLGAGSLAAGTWLVVEPASAGALLQWHAAESAAAQEPLLRRVGAGYLVAGFALVWSIKLGETDQMRVRLGTLLYFGLLAAMAAGEWQAGVPAGETAVTFALLPVIALGLLFLPAGRVAKARPAAAVIADAPAGTEVGTIKWFDGRKGFGFINRSNGEELFVHYRSISEAHGGSRALRDGQQVRFRIGQGKKGPQAEDVVPMGKSA